ncbi:hypothetical protein DRP07_00760 [Archaeoglobales archaeon]|nr:MAG: hypothetical protein DRP07_00760 [Archaeoglobales archaeon]
MSSDVVEKKYKSISIPEELFSEIQRYIDENKQLGYSSVAEFIKEACRVKLAYFKNSEPFVRADKLLEEKPKQSNEELRKAIAALDTAEDKIMQLIQAKAKAGEVCEVEDDIRLLLRKAKQALRGEN